MGPTRDVPRRRTSTAEYELEVFVEYEAAPAGERGALLRREDLYASLISAWRDQREAGALAAPARPAGARPGGSAEKENTPLRA